MTDIERFLSKAIPDPNSGCWLWSGAINGPSKRPYGQMRASGVKVRANRYAYESFVGQIPKGLYVCHRCDVSICVNPDHLFLGTPRDNVIDMMNKGRNRSGINPWNRSKMICVRGHPLTAENLSKVQKNRRVCLACIRFKYQQKKLKGGWV